MAKTYRLGPGHRAINVLFTAMIQARTGRALRKLAVTRQEALALRKAAGWVRRVLSAG